MESGWQDLAAIGIVLAAGGYLAKLAWNAVCRKPGSGCGSGCGSCSAPTSSESGMRDPKAEQIVSIGMIGPIRPMSERENLSPANHRRWTFRRLFAGWLVLACATSAGAEELADQIRKARPGESVAIPAGRYKLGGVSVPAGVSLRGAGYGATTLDATGNDFGLLVRDGQGETISDLAVMGAGEAIKIVGGSGVVIERVRLAAGVAALTLEGTREARVENAILTDGLSGLLLRDVAGVTACQLTVVGCNSIGLNLIRTRDTAVFNNLVVDVGIGAQVSGDNPGLRLDHNLYVAQFIGKLGSQFARVSIPTWRDSTGGLDEHSVQLPVKFANPSHGDYHVTSALDWSPRLATAADWGAAQLGDRQAPRQDIDGQPHVGNPDLGAFENVPLTSRFAAGKLTVIDDQGTKSAGIFLKDGGLVRYLFQDLPLKAGTYEYVVPTRDQLGRPIPAGDYELRTVEGQFRWRYRMMAANNGVENTRNNSDSNHVRTSRFLPGGRLLIANGWNERMENLRCLGLADHRARWFFSGNLEPRGLYAADGTIYFLRQGQELHTIARLESETGAIKPWNGNSDQPLRRLPGPGEYSGLTELNGELFLPMAAANRVDVLDAATGKARRVLTVNAPRQIQSDSARGLLWMINGFAHVSAIRSDGRPVATFKNWRSPVGLALRDDTLAVAEYETGKIHILGVSKDVPPRLTVKRVVGRGDGPYGPVASTRFWFQKSIYNQPADVPLDLDSGGNLAVTDSFGRVVVLDPRDKPLYETFSQFGNSPLKAPFENDDAAPTRYFDQSGTVSWLIDPAHGAWRPDAYWGHPDSRLPGMTAFGFFAQAGERFGVYRHGWREADCRIRDGILVLRFEGGLGIPAGYYTSLPNVGWVVVRDSNHDGLIDPRDTEREPLKSTDGKPLARILQQRWMYVEPSGDIRSATEQRWVFRGLDSKKRPIYEFPPGPAFAFRDAAIPSPYTAGAANSTQGQSETAMLDDRGLFASFQWQQGAPQGMGYSNSGAIDIARFRPDGRLRWLRPMNDFSPVQGVKACAGFLLSSYGHQVEWMGMDEDGLGLGHVGYPPESNWFGYWVDHPNQYDMFRGNDGRLHVIAGDYMINAMHWLTLEHTTAKHRSRANLHIDAAQAKDLAAAPFAPPTLVPRPTQPRIVIRRLEKPLPIDGDPAKWRALGIAPQIMITPVTAHGSIDSASDASAVARLAYHGKDIYIHVVRFDDVVTFHQPTASGNMQDTLEVMFNGYQEGFQWNLARYADAGEAIVRRRFYYQNLTKLIPAEVAPRVVRVLNDVRDLPERALMESATGEDLSRAKAILYEFRMPVDERSYEGSTKSIFPVEPGKGFWFGLMISDNDTPGSDVQDYAVWPPSFGSYEVKERGAWAVFEK